MFTFALSILEHRVLCMFWPSLRSSVTFEAHKAVLVEENVLFPCNN